MIDTKALGARAVEEAIALLSESTGGQVSFRQLEAFYSEILALITEKLFLRMLSTSGPVDARRSIHMALSGASARVRLAKVPFLLNFTVEVTPMEASKEAPKPEPEKEPKIKLLESPAPQKVDECRCEETGGGDCKVCRTNLEKAYAHFVVFVRGYLDALAKESGILAQNCKGCAVRYSDEILTAMGRKVVGAGAIDPVEAQALGITAQTAQIFGIAELPLLAEAFQETENRARNGSEPKA